MKILVKAKTGAKKRAIKKVSEGVLEVSVKELPIEGRANDAIRKSVAEYLGVPQSGLKLVKGIKSKTKIFKTVD